MKRFITLVLLMSPVMTAAQTTNAAPGYGTPSGYGSTTGYGSADGYASQASPYLTRSQITSGNINRMRYATPTVNLSLMSPQAAKEQYSETHNPDGSPK